MANLGRGIGSTPYGMYNAAELDSGDVVLEALKKVDGAGSGIDADSIQGLSINDVDTRPVISYISKSGHNSQAILLNGGLYTAGGSVAAYSDVTSGRNANGGDIGFGVLNNFHRVNIPNISPIKKVGGFRHAYAFTLLENGDLYTWGNNNYGQCGLGHNSTVVHPTLATSGVLDVYEHPSQGEYSVADSRLFILKNDGLYGTGYNGRGQLGIGNLTAVINAFTKCIGLTNLSKNDIKKVYPIGGAYGYTVVLTSDNKIWISGSNGNGSSGDGTIIDSSTFHDITSFWASNKTVQDIKVTGAARYYDNTDHGRQESLIMLLTYTDGTSEVKTAGHNIWGQLGNGTIGSYSSTPTVPIGLPIDGSIVDIAGFGGPPLTVQALTSDGDLWAWGYNSNGQVGNGTIITTGTPSIVEYGVTKLFSDGLSSHSYSYVTQSFIQKIDGLYVSGHNASNLYAGIGSDTITNITSHRKVLLPEDDNNVIDIGHFTVETYARITLALTSKMNIYVWGFGGRNGLSDTQSNPSGTPALVNLPKSNK